MAFGPSADTVVAMSPVETLAPDAAEAMPTDLMEVGAYVSEQAAFERGLVVLALGRSYWTLTDGGTRRLLVEPEVAARVREHLAKYERECEGWPPPPLVDPVSYPTDVITPLLWAAAVLAIFQLQRPHPEWVEWGALDAAALVRGGEWWRAATALWLHGDGAHVVSNALSGAVLFTAVLKTFGRVWGWLLVGVAAVLANAGVAWLAYPVAYRSLGASTAIFAGLGLLTGRALRVFGRTAHPERRRAMFVALGSGVVVLALYGAGGGTARVDLGAHLAGFAVGALVGALAAPAEKSAT